MQALSTHYDVRRLTEADIPDVYQLCLANRRYYRYAKMEPTQKNLTEVIRAMPEGTTPDNKHFVGFYNREGRLVAILDLITHYPDKNQAFIGWLMVDAALQGQGIGSKIFADISAALAADGYHYISLGVIVDNKEAIAFWKKQGFAFTGREKKEERYTVAVMGRAIGMA